VAAAAREEEAPLMEVGNVADTGAEAAAPARRAPGGELTRLDLPRKPEIFDHILTHNDWDGIISGALLKHFSPLARIEITTVNGVRWALRSLAKNPDKPHRLFITDVGISSESLADIEDEARRLAEIVERRKRDEAATAKVEAKARSEGHRQAWHRKRTKATAAA